MKETYSVKAACNNCGIIQMPDIPIGILLEDFPCRNCKCDSLRCNCHYHHPNSPVCCVICKKIESTLTPEEIAMAITEENPVALGRSLSIRRLSEFLSEYLSK